MNYLKFREKLLPMGVFSISHVNIFFPGFDKRRLVEWQEKGYKKTIHRLNFFRKSNFTQKARKDLLIKFIHCHTIHWNQHLAFTTLFGTRIIILEAI